MKNILIVLILVFVLLCTGCQQQNITKTPDSITISNTSNTLTNIYADSVKSLSSDEAISLCQEVIGTKDDENFMFQVAEIHTGNDIGYRCDGAFESDDKQYYIISMLWTGANDSTWSTIGSLGVSSDGDEIYEVIVHGDGSCSLEKIIWEK